MTHSYIIPILGALIIVGSQSGLATAATAYDPEADFVARLSGKTFTVERVEGASLKSGNPSHTIDSDVGKPLEDRAETLGGRIFTVQRAEGGAYRPENPAAESASVEIIGNPLQDRAETLGGKAFTVGSAEGKPETDLSRSYLARFE